MSNKIFYNTVNGIKDGGHAIVENGELYDFLLGNGDVLFARDGTEEIVIGEYTLNDIQNSNRGFSEAENILIGFMLYHIDYVGGFIFKTFEEGE